MGRVVGVSRVERVYWCRRLWSGSLHGRVGVVGDSPGKERKTLLSDICHS